MCEEWSEALIATDFSYPFSPWIAKKMSTGINGDAVSLVNSVVLGRNSLRIVVMERVEMHIAQHALPGGTKTTGATTDVRVASHVLS